MCRIAGILDRLRRRDGGVLGPRVSLPDLLRYEDRNSMTFGVESRVPFLTPQIAEFVFSLPSEYLISRSGISKHVFREAMRDLVPNAILDRRDKVGFATPERPWLQTLTPWAEQILQSEAALSIPFFRHGELLQEFRSVVAERKKFDWRLWRWLNLIRWTDLFDVEY